MNSGNGVCCLIFVVQRQTLCCQTGYPGIVIAVVQAVITECHSLCASGFPVKNSTLYS
jgi:hypothetical protein